MTQNNLFMEADDMRLYIDVQPLFIDELENSKNAAAVSAALAAQCEEAARGWKNDIEDYKTGLELFYAQATDGIENSYNDSISGLNSAKNSAISNISLTSQVYINQAKYYAEQAQTIVDNRVSKDHLNQSKGLLTGAVSTDTDVLADVKNYAHSTYCGHQASNTLPLDPKKFIKAGSLVITDDGIASGFSSSNYLKFPFPDVTSKNYRIDIPMHYKATNPATLSQAIISDVPNGYSTRRTSLYVYNNYILLNLSSDGTNWNITVNNTNYRTLTDGKDYIISFVRTATSYKVLATDLETGIEQEYASVDSTTDLYSTTNRCCLGFATTYGDAYTPILGYVDLKYFSSKENGVPVFSGNHTGIDTIKPDDFTLTTTLYAYSDGTHTIYANNSTIANVVKLYNANGSNYTGSDFVLDTTNHTIKYNGTDCSYVTGGASNITLNTQCDASLKISGDGIVSDIRNNSRISKTWTNNKPFTVKGRFKLSSSGAEQTLLYLGSYNATQFSQFGLGLLSNNNLYGYCYLGSTTYSLGSISLGTLNNSIVEFEWNIGLTSQTLKVTVDGVEKTTTPGTADLSGHTLSLSPINFGNRNGTGLLLGSIDLNAFKIYVDGDLVYQPCLKIPYTESKTGCKVVDSIYRNRVTDMYEQLGYSNYYTFDEKNGEFTLPMGEVYGMMEKLRELIIQRTSSGNKICSVGI